MIRINKRRPIDVINEAIDEAIKQARKESGVDSRYTIFSTGTPEFTLPEELGDPNYWKHKGLRAILVAPNSLIGKPLFHLDKVILIETYDNNLLIKPRKGYEKEFNWYLIRSH